MTEKLGPVENKPQVGDVFTSDEALRQWMHQIIMVLMQGMIRVLVPRMLVEKVLLVFTHTCARLVCEFYAGDDIAVHKLRKSCRDMFFETTKQMPIIPLPKPPSEKTDTALNL